MGQDVQATRELWTAVDGYIAVKLVEPDEALYGAMRDSALAGLPAIAVSACQGKFLQLLARVRGAKHILEIGTLGGFSTIWLARALPPGGRLVTLEMDTRHAAIARKNLERAGLKVGEARQEGVTLELRLGRALDTLPQLAAEGWGGVAGKAFDLVFVDADKESIPEYVDWAIKLGRAGSAIVVDNVVRKGALVDAASTDPDVQGVRRFHDMLANDRRVSAITMQTVGHKGYDGFTLAVVN